jgi:glycosyltransferase involved in cell wall biosynthesis
MIPVAAMAARLERFPHAWFVREYGDRDRSLQFQLGRRLTLNLVGRLSQTVLVNSRALCEWVRPQIHGARFFVVPPAVEIAAHAATPALAPTGVVRLLLVGERTPGKGQDQAIKALAALRKDGIRASLTLVGGGVPTYDSYLRALSRHLGAEDSVALVPFQENVAQFYEQADIALVCSASEAFGRVTVEAMKMGRPVVAAASGGTVELIRPGQTGLLYSPGNSTELARQIATLCLDWGRATEIAVRAQQWACRRFNAHLYGRRLERALRTCVMVPRSDRERRGANCRPLSR